MSNPDSKRNLNNNDNEEEDDEDNLSSIDRDEEFNRELKKYKELDELNEKLKKQITEIKSHYQELNLDLDKTKFTYDRNLNILSDIKHHLNETDYQIEFNNKNNRNIPEGIQTCEKTK